MNNRRESCKKNKKLDDIHEEADFPMWDPDFRITSEPASG